MKWRPGRFVLKANRRVLLFAGVFVAALVIVLVSLPSQQLRNTPELSIIKERGVLRVGVRTDMPGFAQDGQGFEIDLATRFAQYLLPDAPASSAVEFVTVDARTLGAHIDNGDADVVLALAPKDFSSSYVYSRAYYEDACRFLCVAGKESLPLSQARVGTLQVSPLSSRLSSRLKSEPAYVGEQIQFASYPDMLYALVSGQIDAALMPGAYVSRYLDSSFTVRSEEFGTLEYALMCGTDAPALAGLFDLFLDQCEDDGTLESLMKTYSLGG
ncbi:MAG: transporter substrate-binding domain-containing protein [Bacillota bacterium]